MTYLFICRANVGRSQAASALFNKYFNAQSRSAGTMVDMPGELLSQREGAKNIITTLGEYGVDISSCYRTQLTEDMANSFDKLVVLAEPAAIPDWLRTNPRAIFWDVQDTKAQDLEATRRIVGEIAKKVQELSDETTR